MVLQSDFAYKQTKEMIFHMEFLPGEHISELQIASKLQISRTPVRDALRRLEAEGLVSIKANRGAEVRFFDDDEKSEIGAVRLAQDMLAAKLAAYFGSASDFDRLNDIAKACQEAAAQGDKYERIRQDILFHLAITEIGKNTRLLKQQRDLYQLVHLIQVSTYTNVEDSLAQIHHHEPMVSALRAGNISDANNLICQHIKGVYRIDPYLLKQYGYTV